MTTPSDPNGLPQFPSAPPPSEYGNAPQTYTPPNELMASFWCYLGAAVIVLVGGLFYTGQKQAVLDTLRATNTANLTETQLESAAGFVVVFVVVVAAVIAALYAFFAFKMRAGRNWARIVLTVIAALDLLSLVSGRGAGTLGLIGALAAIVGCVLSYLPNSGAYFSAVKASRYRG